MSVLAKALTNSSRLAIQAVTKIDFILLKCHSLINFPLIFFFCQPILNSVKYSSTSSNLRDVMSDLIPAEQKRVAAFRKEHGSFKIGEVTVDMVSPQETLLTYLLPKEKSLT